MLIISGTVVEAIFVDSWNIFKQSEDRLIASLSLQMLNTPENMACTLYECLGSALM